MANQLKMAKISAILTLRERGWSQRRIARELGVHRETVGRYVRLAREGPPAAGSGESKPAKVLTGSGPPGEPKAAKVLAGCEGISGATSGGGGRSRCEPYRSVILEFLERGLSGQRIYQDLIVEHGFEGSYCSVQRFVRRLNGAGPAPFRRMECEPGAEAQVDFGTGAMITMPDGRRRRSWVFRIILSFSRKGYSETVFRQTTDEFIRCIENAFHRFGGVPKTLVIDNLRAAVTKADWYEPELNPKITAFAEHYGTVILPTKSYTPRHKGKVERGVDYVQNNGLKGRQFTSLADQNRHLLHWERTVADTRIHGTTRKQVGRLFEEVERSALLPLPSSGARFPHFQEAQRSVHRDGHVEVEKAYYSVPPEYLGHRLWVRWDGRVVRIFDSRMKQIAVHAQREPGRFSTQSRHIAPEKISNVERGTSWMLHRAALIGPQTRRWAESMVQQRGIEGGRVLVGLLSLANRYESDRIEQACRLAHGHGSYRLRMIRQLLKRSHPAASEAQEQFEFTHEHPIIRSLSDYQRLVTTSLHIVRPRKASDEPTINGNGNSRSHHHERHTDHSAETASSLGDRSGPGCSPSGSGRQQPQPQRVPGTDLGR